MSYQTDHLDGPLYYMDSDDQQKTCGVKGPLGERFLWRPYYAIRAGVAYYYQVDHRATNLSAHRMDGWMEGTPLSLLIGSAVTAIRERRIAIGCDD